MLTQEILYSIDQRYAEINPDQVDFLNFNLLFYRAFFPPFHSLIWNLHRNVLNTIVEGRMGLIRTLSDVKSNNNLPAILSNLEQDGTYRGTTFHGYFSVDFIIENFSERYGIRRHTEPIPITDFPYDAIFESFFKNTGIHPLTTLGFERYNARSITHCTARETNRRPFEKVQVPNRVINWSAQQAVP